MLYISLSPNNRFKRLSWSAFFTKFWTNLKKLFNYMRVRQTVNLVAKNSPNAFCNVETQQNTKKYEKFCNPLHINSQTDTNDYVD